jgi:phage repressor protein C with HTH and peptisase S24 domain
VIRHEFRARPEDLHIVTIDGDSMEPMRSTGDRITVDTSRRVPAPPGIFVIWDGMGIVAKCIEHVPHSEPIKVIIKSLNTEYQTYERNAEEVNMIGRVVWASKRL